MLFWQTMAVAVRSRVAPLGTAVALGIVAATGLLGGCFGATEIDVELTTTVPCEQRIQTQLFTGARGTTDFGAAPAAETAECTTAEPRIGTLSIVPSGAQDAAFDLEVVAGVGVEASTCRPGHLDRCIVVRRRATFLKHKALRLPVLLSDRCIGVVCGQDETCDLGLCAKTDDCTDVGCPRERGDVHVESDAGPDAVADAVVDGPAEVGVPDSAMGECGPVAQTVVAGQEIQGQLSMQGADFVYVNGGNTSAAEIRRVPRTGGTAVKLMSMRSGFTALAANETGMFYASMFAGSMILTRRRLDGMEASTGYGNETNWTLAMAGTTLVGISNLMSPATTLMGFHAFASASPGARSYGTPQLPGPVPEIVVDEDGEWYGVSNHASVLHFAATSESLIDKLEANDAAGDIAVANRTLYVALSTKAVGGASAVGIHAIPRGNITASYAAAPLVPNVTPITLAAAGSDLYFIAGNKLSRVDLTSASTSASAPVPLATVGAGATALAVDAACVYWVEGGTKIMKRARR